MQSCEVKQFFNSFFPVFVAFFLALLDEFECEGLILCDD